MDKLTSLLLKLPIFDGKYKELKKTALYGVRAVCLLLVAACVFGAAYFIIPKKSVVTDTTYTSSVGLDVSYEVNLTENDFFESDVLQMDENYIRTLVDSVDVDFDIDCSQYGVGETIVSYTVTARTSAWYRDGSENLLIWAMDETLVEASSSDMSQSDCTVNIPVSIQPKMYSNMIESFQKDMELNVNAYYDIVISAEATYISEGKGFSNSFSGYASIPLTGQVFKISTEAPQDRFDKSFTESTIVESEPNMPLFVVFAIAALLAIAAALTSFLCLTEVKVDRFKEKLGKMISQVEDRIAYVQGSQDCGDNDIPLADFDSILRLADERALPILCVRDDVARKVTFFVTENNQKFYYGFSGESAENELEQAQTYNEER